jgi:hypothetical protein
MTAADRPIGSLFADTLLWAYTVCHETDSNKAIARIVGVTEGRVSQVLHARPSELRYSTLQRFLKPLEPAIKSKVLQVWIEQTFGRELEEHATILPQDLDFDAQEPFFNISRTDPQRALELFKDLYNFDDPCDPLLTAMIFSSIHSNALRLDLPDISLEVSALVEQLDPDRAEPHLSRLAFFCKFEALLTIDSLTPSPQQKAKTTLASFEPLRQAHQTLVQLHELCVADAEWIPWGERCMAGSLWPSCISLVLQEHKRYGNLANALRSVCDLLCLDQTRKVFGVNSHRYEAEVRLALGDVDGAEEALLNFTNVVDWKSWFPLEVYLLSGDIMSKRGERASAIEHFRCLRNESLKVGDRYWARICGQRLAALHL